MGKVLSKNKIPYIVAICTLLITLFSTFALATSQSTTIPTLDVTPPRGKIEVKNVIQSDDLKFVTSTEIDIEVIAEDDSDGEIQYFVSGTPISKAEEIPEESWIKYIRRQTTTVTLPNADGNNTIYLVLRDEVGNTSLIYDDSNVEYTIEYNVNAADATGFSTTVDTKAYYGMPFKVTSRIPTRDGYYFLGWSTNADATTPSYRRSGIIPANVFFGGSKTITLYAVWAENSTGDVEISELVDVGDYVEFPVSYDNVNGSTYTGWRVISKDIDLDGNSAPGRVNIVSAGTPLTYYHYNDSDFSVTALTDNFLTTDFSNTENYTYRKNGFLPNKTLTQIFTNKFVATKEDGVTPDVRAMVAEDIYRVTNLTSMTNEHIMDLANSKYDNLLVNESNYWLASSYDETNLWDIAADGYVEEYNSNEYGIRPVVSLKAETIIKGTDSTGEWIVEHPGYTVTYVVTEGEMGEVPNSEKKTFGVDLPITTKEPTREGRFSFLGWSTTEGAEEAEYLVTDKYTTNADVTLYDVWKKNDTVVTYDANGGTFDTGTTNEVVYGYSKTIITKTSRTSNVSEDGTIANTSTGYGNNQSITDVITIPGATGLEVTITYQTESTSYDWVCLYDGSVTPSSSNYSSSISGKLGGKTKTTQTFTIPGDTVQIYFRSDSSQCSYYGYYAEVNGKTFLTNVKTGEYKEPTKEYYNLRGWSVDKEATTIEYELEEEFILNIDNIILYAVWEEKMSVNPPVLGQDENGNLLMEAVYWSDENATTELTATAFTGEMYNYEMGDGVTDTKQSKWANAKTLEDGSYWVWIPRYAYKITYYTDSTKVIESTSKTGYGKIDVLFMFGKSNSKYRNTLGEPEILPEGYIVHPAFQKMTTKEDLGTNPLGKWDEELEGIWVAKYEASKGTSGKPESKPSVLSWDVNPNTAYAICENMYLDLNSHQMKNSEWGAVAYLTYSAYGRNGNELAVNQCLSKYTGGGPGEGESTILNRDYESDLSTFNTTYAWNTTQGKLASTTGNIYGIYDMSGGLAERMASYVNTGDSYLKTYGAEMINSEKLRNKQIYSIGTSDSGINNYNANNGVYGDAIYETSTSYSQWYSWCGDYSNFPYSRYALFSRGGYSNAGSFSGIFAFSSLIGSESSIGFRPILCIN